ncbi:MAG: HAMP domain-containing histidine kinase [Firmicutes bacterium]|uniref:histidine kinase n=1 Tax=Candidatus Scybalomonas excrementavium TaxID=2840943 RepID=A0A9D9N6S8_9FIRM|nr:HAMP domain-containing histidine kinase [Candidatus Scybalomonas excrementavium]
MKNKSCKKVNLIRSFRLKIAMYTFISLWCTFLTDIVIICLMFLYHTQTHNHISQIARFEQKQIEFVPYSMENNQNFRTFFRFFDENIGLTGNMLIDMILLIGFSAILFTAYFVLISHNMVHYLREIQAGIERIKEGDFDTNIRVVNEDELSKMANSINEMRYTIKELMEKERVVEKTKNDLITNVAHDLRTPLTSIIGYLELLQNEESFEMETRKKYLNIVYEKAKRLQNLVVDLFDYTRYAKDGVTIRKRNLEWNRFVEQVLEEFYPNFQSANLEYEAILWNQEIYLMADGELLARAFGNLIANAIQYGVDGKLVIVKTARIGNEAMLSITNFGQVIPKQELSKIFEKFYRVETSRSMATGGTGLGLAITKNIISLHQGTISVSSNENGTTFKMSLPIK